MSLSQSDRSQTKDHYAKFGDFFQESIKQKLQSLQQICFQMAEKVLSENLSCKKARIPVAFYLLRSHVNMTV